jgi:hypothetical protein
VNPFAEDIAGAREAIAEDGCEAVWWKEAPDDPDAEPWREGDGEPTEHPLRVAIFSPRDLGFGSGSFGSLSDGTEIPTSAEIAMFAAEPDFEPELTDWIVLPNSGKSEVVRLDRLAPNDIPILWFAWIVR